MLTIGVAAVGDAIANVAANRAPDLALQFSPGQPVALAAKANVELRLDRQQEAERLARASIRSTALSSTGFQVLGLIEAAGQDKEKAERLFEYTARLNRRETPAQMWLFQEGLLDGDVASALRRLDGAMRVSEESRPTLYPILASLIAADPLVAPVAEIFASDPIWLRGFLAYAIRNDTSLKNLARIVAALPRGTSARTEEREAALLRGLIEAGEYSQARAFMHAVAPTRVDTSVRDPSFVVNGPYAPFDWNYFTAAGLGASPTGWASGGLRYHAGTGQGGVVARQLITLDPGFYSLASEIRMLSTNSDGHSFWTVTCAGTRQLEVAQMPLRGGTGEGGPVSASANFQIPTSGCTAQWLDLNVHATFAPGGTEGVIKNIRIEPLAGEQFAA